MSIQKPKVFWPLTISASNRVLPFSLDAAPLTANVATGEYLSAVALAAAIQTALIAAGVAGSTDEFLVTVSSTGHFIINPNGDGEVSFTFFSNPTNIIAEVIGFDPDFNTDPSTDPVTAPYQHQNGWYSDVATADDSLLVRDRSMDVVTRTVEGQTKFLSEQELVNRAWIFRWLNPEKTYIDFEGDNLNEAIERWWEDGRGKFRYWADGTAESDYADYVLDLETIREFRPKRQRVNKGIYEVSFGAFGYVS